eukprot:7308238-Pyramimonas_sp.AAC.1
MGMEQQCTCQSKLWSFGVVSERCVSTPALHRMFARPARIEREESGCCEDREGRAQVVTHYDVRSPCAAGQEKHTFLDDHGERNHDMAQADP